MAEPYITVLKRERDTAIRAVFAVLDWMDAREKAENTAYKYDALKVSEAKRETMLAALAEAKPLIDKEAKSA